MGTHLCWFRLFRDIEWLDVGKGETMNGMRHGCATGTKAVAAVLWLALLAAMATTTAAQEESWNIEVVGQVGGGCRGVQADGDYAFIGEGPNVTALDVSSSSDPLVLDRLRFRGTVGDTFLEGNYIYASNWVDGLLIIDVSNPEELDLVSSYPMQAYSLHVHNDLAYVTNLAGGFEIIDVSDPTSPVLVTKFPLPTNYENIMVDGNLAIMVGVYTGLHAFDVTDPSSPIVLNTFMDVLYPFDLATSGHIAYVAGASFYTLDYTDPTSPVLLSTFEVDGYGMGLFVDDTYAYVGTTSGVLHILDVTDPTSPTLVGMWEGAVLPATVYVVGTTAYVCDAHRGLYVLDVSDPSAPVETGFFGTPIGIHVIRIPSAAKAFIAAYDFYTIDINDPSKPEVFAIYETPNEVSGLDVSGNLAFVTHDVDLDLLILNIGDPSSPTLTGVYYPETGGGGSAAKLAKPPFGAPALGPRRMAPPENMTPKAEVRGNRGIVSGFTTGTIEFLDIGDPSSPTQISTYGLPGFVGDIDIQGNTAYICNGNLGLAVFNISNETNPNKLGVYADAWALSFHLSDIAAQIGDGNEGLWLVDLSDPSSPTTKSYYPCPGSTHGIDESGHLAFTASDLYGLHVVNIHDPTSPTLTGHFNSRGKAVDVKYHGGLIYLADYYTGLWILNYTGPQPITPVDPATAVRDSTWRLYR
jgi:hypothetical protein